VSVFSEQDGVLLVRQRHETVRIQAWGRDSVRVRAWEYREPVLDEGALTTPPGGEAPEVSILDPDAEARLVNGRITVVARVPEVDAGTKAVALIRFLDTATGEELLAESREHFWWPGARVYFGNLAGSSEIHQQFAAYDGERIYGMGQRTHGYLDHKGLSLDLVQRNAEVSIPFAVSSRGYGFLWNNPAIGKVEFATNFTRWTADQAQAIDYWITAGTPAQILGRYADATGHAPELPEWASGFWQSKLRYKDQAELMEVVREYRRREIPLSVIVTDFFHWTAMGDFRLDPAEYPDPESMMAELAEADVKLMVSVWPTVSALSENYPQLHERGLLVGTDQGQEFVASIQDKGMKVPMPIAFYDPTNPETREFIWQTVKKNYFDLGVRVWWLDACEPEINPGDHKNLRYYTGPGGQVGCIYPRDNARLFGEAMAAEGEETVLLCRSAWAGQQKYSAAVWSGDIPATWDALRRQVRAGLSIAMAGIPWWTTDIGGFHGGNVEDDDYRELMIRWFQYGAFCPLFRLHGYREPRPDIGWDASGGPNEIWSYGEEAYEIIRSVVLLRERIRPYLHEQMSLASTEGLPPMRPLFVDFPDDEAAWDVDDQMMFGPDVLVAPVLELGSRSRSVYLPAGVSWRSVWTGEAFDGGRRIDVDAPLERIPVFLREGADVPIA
jgi:alpha-D-xyloside xylohydrolase